MSALGAVVEGLAPMVAVLVERIAGRPTTNEEAKAAIQQMLKEDLPELNIDRDRLKAIADGDE